MVNSQVSLNKSNRDAETISSLVEHAYRENAMISWLLGAKSSNKIIRKCIFDFFLKDACNARHVFVSSNGGAVLIYDLPTDKKSWLEKLNFAFHAFSILDIQSLKRFMLREKYIKEMRVKHPHIYCALLAGTSDAEGTAGVYELKNFIIKLSEEIKIPLVAEATDERLVVVYKRIGFKEYFRLTLPGANFETVFLERKASNNKSESIG